MKSFFWFFRLPESLIAFFSGACISIAITYFTSNESGCVEYASAGLFTISSIVFILWSIIVKQNDESYQLKKSATISSNMSTEEVKAKCKENWLAILSLKTKCQLVMCLVFSLACSIVAIVVVAVW